MALPLLGHVTSASRIDGRSACVSACSIYALAQGRACFGSDNFVACAQLMNVRASTPLPVQQRILRRFFWFCSWAQLEMSLFWVPSDLNPADPPSKVDDF